MMYWYWVAISVCLGSLGKGFSQSPNDSIYFQLIHAYAQEIPLPVAEVEGLLGMESGSVFSKDSSSHIRLRFSAPDLSYRKVEDKTYIRNIQVLVRKQDSLLQQKTLQFQDTLSLTTLRQIRKRSSPEFKGDNPTIWGRWWVPVIVLGTGIGSIFTLFWVRS